MISSAPKTGGAVTTVAGSDNARSVTVDGACLYWATSAGQFHEAAPVGVRAGPKSLALPP